MSFTGVCLLLSRRSIIIEACGIQLTLYPCSVLPLRKESLEFVLSLSHLINVGLYQVLTYELTSQELIRPLSLLLFTVEGDSTHLGAVNVSYNLQGNKLNSVELLWPSASWQEREMSEMFGVVYANKRDARSLFTSSLNKLLPLRKSTPTSGFYELSRVGGSLVACRLEAA